MKLQDFDHLRNNKFIKFKEEIIDNNTVVIITYSYQDNALWDIPLAIECRGHVFDKDSGECIGVGLEKFFRLNENKYTQYKDLDFSNCRFYTKLDGSMIQIIGINGKLYTKTKKSFFSEVSTESQTNFNKVQNLQELSKYLIERKYTPIFEYYSPNWKVVIDYGNIPKFTLIKARNFKTLEYMNYDELKLIADKFNVDIVDQSNLTLEEILREDKSNAEGYVVQLNNGKHVKIKY